MPSAEIIAIGTELVLGQIQDTNTRHIARALNEIGVDVFRASIIGDNKFRISEEIKSSFSRADMVFTTGGLGPTVDDPTREAVSIAFGKPLEFREELWVQIKNRFHSFGREPTDNNKRQAYIPESADAIENPVGTAPAFCMTFAEKMLISLPGVPSEMESLLEKHVIPLIKKKFKIEGTIFSRVIHTAGIGESNLDEMIEDLEKSDNPTVGLAAYPGRVDIRITVKAKNNNQAKKKILPIEKEIQKRLGVKIYGFDETTLEESVNELLHRHGLDLYLIYEINCEDLVKEFIDTGIFRNVIKSESVKNDLFSGSISLYNGNNDQLIFLILSCAKSCQRTLSLRLTDHKSFDEKIDKRSGYTKLFEIWVKNQTLEFIRESIIKNKGAK